MNDVSQLQINASQQSSSHLMSNQANDNQAVLPQVDAKIDELKPDSTLADSVERTVSRYMQAMEGQQIRDLYELVLSEVEAPLLECILKSTDNNQSQTATILGLNRGTLRKKLKKYGML